MAPLCTPATRSSTWAAAAAGTRSRRCGAARRVTALDYSAADLKDVAAVVGAMIEAGEIRVRPVGRRGQRRRARPAVPRRHASTASIVSEVLEHIWDDERALAEIVRVLRPGGRIAATVPTRWPERVCWALN